MRCAVIHAFPPHRYNLQAPTANPYQNLKFAPDELELDLYYYSGREECRASSVKCINELRLNSISEMPRPTGASSYVHRAMAWARGLPYGVGRFPVQREFAKRINDSSPDLVWIYPHWLIDWKTALKCKNVVVTGADSAVLHNERALRYGDLSPRDARKQKSLLVRNMKLERTWGSSGARMHMVGEADVKRYIELNDGNAKAFFVRHPLYDHLDVKENLVEKKGKIVVMTSGRGDSIYVGSYLRRAVESIESTKGLADSVEIRFLGSVYDDFAGRLKKAGFECSAQTWVDDYETEMAEAQVHVFPIAVGTGTKGKVLTAFGTGSLVVGSEFALENIAVVPGKDCLMFDRPEEVGGMLLDVLAERERYADMAANGKRKVIEAHDPAKVAKEFWQKAMEPEA